MSYFIRQAYATIISMKITNLASTHAGDAARLHIAGQPGTFLTGLGSEVLTVFYWALPQSATGFGFVMENGAPDDRRRLGQAQLPAMAGFIAATTSTRRLFLDLGTRHLRHFLPPLLICYGRQPSLIGQSLQTLFYPLLPKQQATTPKTATPVAELLAIMVGPSQRGQGIGTQLVEQLVSACQVRKIAALEVTVDAGNEGARRFYARHGFREEHPFQLYGRPMWRYRRETATQEAHRQ